MENSLGHLSRYKLAVYGRAFDLRRPRKGEGKAKFGSTFPSCSSFARELHEPLAVKFWIGNPPPVDEVRPPECPDAEAVRDRLLAGQLSFEAGWAASRSWARAPEFSTLAVDDGPPKKRAAWITQRIEAIGGMLTASPRICERFSSIFVEPILRLQPS